MDTVGNKVALAEIAMIKGSPFDRNRPGGLLDGCHPVDFYAQVIAQLIADATIVERC